MTHQIDRHINIYHDGMKAQWTSGDKLVSDLYVSKQYRALLIENERLQKELDELTGAGDGVSDTLDAVDFDEDEQAMFLTGNEVANILAAVMADIYAASMPDAADFDEDEQAMFLMGTGRM